MSLPGGLRDSLERLFDFHVVIFLLFLVLVVALKFATLQQPPVWDTAFSVFPAAITLDKNGFDIVALLTSPGYRHGGPNSHALSLVTYVTALVYRFTDTPSQAFLVLHLIHFTVAALVLVSFYRLSKEILGPVLALAVCTAILFLPIFRVQAGYMYLELPLLLCAVNAIDGFRLNRLLPAFVWVLLAVLVKQTGIVLSVALAMAVLVESRPWPKRVLLSAVFLLPAALITVLELSVVASSSDTYSLAKYYDAPFMQAVLTVAACAASDIPRYLFMIPDVAGALLGALVIGILRLRPLLRGLVWVASDANERRGIDLQEDKTLAVSLVYILCFLGFFYVALPISGLSCATLPRYFVIIAPFVALILIATALKLFSSPALSAVVLIVTVVFAVNRAGALYPSDIDDRVAGNNFAATERSEAYRNLLGLQLRGLEIMQRLPADVSVVYALPVHFFSQYPELGYVERKLSNGVSIYPDLGFLARPVEQYPDCFVMFHLSRYLGGGAMLEAFEHIGVLPGWQAEVVAELQSGPYKAHFMRLHLRGTPCLEGFDFLK